MSNRVQGPGGPKPTQRQPTDAKQEAQTQKAPHNFMTREMTALKGLELKAQKKLKFWSSVEKWTSWISSHASDKKATTQSYLEDIKGGIEQIKDTRGELVYLEAELNDLRNQALLDYLGNNLFKELLTPERKEYFEDHIKEGRTPKLTERIVTEGTSEEFAQLKLQANRSLDAKAAFQHLKEMFLSEAEDTVLTDKNTEPFFEAALEEVNSKEGNPDEILNDFANKYVDDVKEKLNLKSLDNIKPSTIPREHRKDFLIAKSLQKYLNPLETASKKAKATIEELKNKESPTFQNYPNIPEGQLYEKALEILASPEGEDIVLDMQNLKDARKIVSHYKELNEAKQLLAHLPEAETKPTTARNLEDTSSLPKANVNKYINFLQDQIMTAHYKKTGSMEDPNSAERTEILADKALQKNCNDKYTDLLKSQ